MVIDINKNSDNYKETVLLGLTAKQLVLFARLDFCAIWYP